VNFLSSVVMKLQPKPTHIVVNSGQWGFLNPQGLRNLFAAGNEIQRREGTRFVWKTITHGVDDTNHSNQVRVNFEKRLALTYGWGVFDAYDITSIYAGRDQFYRDKLHFDDQVSTHLNRVFFEAFLNSSP